MLSPDQCARLVDSFTVHDYRVDAVIDALGVSAHRALGRNHTVAAERALADRTDPLATLIALWPLQRPVPVRRVDQALPGLRLPMLRAGLLAQNQDLVRAVIDIRPYASDDQSFWVCADLTPGLDSVVRPTRPDLVLGVSQASSSLAQLTCRAPVARALDLGTGCGVQSLHLARHAGSITATDLNPRAVELAQLTFAINTISVEVRQGDLYAPVADQLFDLITSNPPYVMSPPAREQRLAYREGNLAGDALVERVVRQGADRLRASGLLCVLGNWAHLNGRPWEDRLAGWIAPGCDAHIVQRELLDPSEYVEIWLADAGLAGSPGYRRRYGDWLDYFDRLGVAAVGLGWIVVHRTGTGDPSIRIEHRPYDIEQPIAAGLDRERRGVAADRRLTDEMLPATRLVVADDVVQETSGSPGAADPAHLVLRQQRGLRRAERVDTALAGVVGACDGELALGTILDSVAVLLDIRPDRLRAHLVPQIRRLLIQGYLAPAA